MSYEGTSSGSTHPHRDQEHSVLLIQLRGVVLSGTSKEKHGGVGAIVAPWMRPALLDVLQVSSRITQLSFKKGVATFMSLVHMHHIQAWILKRSGTPTRKASRPNWKLYPNLSQCTSQAT